MTKTIRYKSRLSNKRILISTLILLSVPIIRFLVQLLVKNDTIAFTLALNLAACILIIYDWNLVGIHYNRAKEKPIDTLIYILIGLVINGFLIYLGLKVLKAPLLLSDPETTKAYLFASPAIMLAFSFIQSALLNLGFKCLTDHFRVHNQEYLVIILSGIIYHLLACFVAGTLPFGFFSLLANGMNWIYGVLIGCSLSYLYNQSNSLVPGIVSYGLILLIVQIIQILS